ncbi:MAG: AraC family transcriptional regulator [Bacillota bacterium]
MPSIHSHDYFEAFLVISGSAVHHVNGGNFDLSKGSLVIVRPEDEHCYLHPMSSDFKFINLIIVTESFNRLICFLGNGFNSRELLESKYPPQRDLRGTKFEPLVSTLDRLMVFPKTDIERYNTAFLFAVIEIVCCFFYENEFGSNRSTPIWINRLVSEMYKPENYSRGLEAMYNLSNCTPEHLCRAFKKYLHTTPSKFLNKLRLEEAARRIIYTDDPIIDISEGVGFENLSHFYHLFKAQYNMSPCKYRKQSRMSPAPGKI